ncbi:unnamed protein product (mitochondrion) [Plasmodiophora brassicae]|uniref:F-box/LRR-repeat protein 15-like leucin rich repeat domain-containing protein n=1 Tax=Plasmodiophora brassicae TaxID=37360 RepID=A0A3P3YC95_PLABS|nr:unnamed protein product [Plasmodiophora brassicae]
MVHCGVQLSELPERARICLSAMLREQSTAAAVARCSRAMRDFVRDYVGEATALDLSGRRDAVAILDAMPADRARNLRDLKLQFCGKAVGTGGDLPRVLARFPSLAVLNLNGCSEVVPESLAAVGSAALTSLSLYWVPKLTDECVTRIVRASSNLRHLNLSGAKLLTNSAVAEIARSLPDLEELDLTKAVRLTDSSLVALSKSCKQLTSFNSYACPNFTDVGVTLLSRSWALKIWPATVLA